MNIFIITILISLHSLSERYQKSNYFWCHTPRIMFLDKCVNVSFVACHVEVKKIGSLDGKKRFRYPWTVNRARLSLYHVARGGDTDVHWIDARTLYTFTYIYTFRIMYFNMRARIRCYRPENPLNLRSVPWISRLDLLRSPEKTSRSICNTRPSRNTIKCF